MAGPEKDENPPNWGAFTKEVADEDTTRSESSKTSSSVSLAQSSTDIDNPGQEASGAIYSEAWRNAKSMAHGPELTVFPVHYPVGSELEHCSCRKKNCPNIGKHPAVQSWKKDASADLGQISEWAYSHQYHNYGVALEGHTVLDVDARNGGLESWERLKTEVAIPETFTVRTGGTDAEGRHGFHAYFKGEMSGKELDGFPGVDIKSGAGAYVVGPGSTHASGNLYEVILNSDGQTKLPAELPEAIRALQGSSRNGSIPSVTSGSASVGVVWDGDPEFDEAEFLARIQPVGKGERDIHLTRMVGAWWSNTTKTDRADIENVIWQMATIIWGDGVHKEITDEIVSGKAAQVAKWPKTTPGDTTDRIHERIPNLPDSVWEATPVLRQIKNFARSRLVSADSVLGAVLARVAYLTPPEYQTPPYVGGNGSYNYIVGMVGPPGAGKSGTLNAARDFMSNVDDEPNGIAGLSPSTGQGQMEAYLGPIETIETIYGPKEVRKMAYERVLFQADEGQTLDKLSSQPGSILLETIRSFWSGGDVGTQNASKDRNRFIEAHTYRYALIVGFQPLKASAIIADVDAGTPQRFTWFAASDPKMRGHVSDGPDGILEGWVPPPRRAVPVVLTYPTKVGELVKAQRIDSGTGDVWLDNFEAHRLMMRIKTAGLLALLHCETTVSDELWDLSGVIIENSFQILKYMLKVQGADRKRSEEATIGRKAREAVALEDALEERQISKHEKACASMAKHIAERSKKLGRALDPTECKNATSSRDRKHAKIGQAREWGLANGVLVKEKGKFRAAA